MAREYTQAMHKRDEAIVQWRERGKTQAWIAEKKNLSVNRVRQILAKKAISKRK